MRSHGFSVGSGAAYGQIVAPVAFVQVSGLEEHVGALADRTDNVVYLLGLVGAQVLYPVIGLVERRTYEFGHAAVDDRELLGSALLHIENARDEAAALGDYAPSKFEMDRSSGRKPEVAPEGVEI